MYKLLFVLVALAVCVFATETQDQEAAEQYFRTYGTYPSWYNYGLGLRTAYAGAAIPAYTAAAIPAYTGAYAGYTPAATAYGLNYRTVGAYPYGIGSLGYNYVY